MLKRTHRFTGGYQLFYKYLILIAFSNTLLASQADNYGLGGSTSGRVSGVTAEIENSHAAIYNPALLAAGFTTLFSFSTGVANTQFAPIQQVFVRDPKTNQLSVQDYQLENLQTTQWSLGYRYPFLLSERLNRMMGIGISLSGPYKTLRSFTGHTPDDFYSVRYGNSDSQFKATLGTAIELWPETIYFGAGLSLYLVGAGNADANLASDNPTGRMVFDVGLNSAWIFGLLGRWDLSTVALTYREAVNPMYEQNFEGIAPVAGNSVTVPVSVKSSLYYEPKQLQLEAQHDYEFLKVSLGVSYQFWDAYLPPILVTTTTDSSGNKTITQLPRQEFENTWNPRASVEVPWFNQRLSTSLGYQYRPTPLKNTNGTSNALDSNTHIVGLSIEHRVDKNIVLPWPFKWGLYGQYHFIEDRKIDKLESTATGAPNYTYSANSYTYGINLEARL